jgi:hypothetical protein
MRAALLVALWAAVTWAQSDPRGRFGRTNSRCAQGRSTRGLPCEDFAFFEFAPASGAGMGSACACTTPTGAKGEALTFTRTGDATCSRSGLATTGIPDGDKTACATNQPRVEASAGVLALKAEAVATNALTRFIDYTNAIWSDVGTPTPTTGRVSPWTGAFANSAVLYDDNDVAAFEGRAQTVTVTAATQHTMSCLVKAGTLSSWTLSLDGTTASGAGLSSTTWSLVTVTDASSSGVAIAAQILNGSTAAATGTVIWGGCQVEVGAFATSMIPTVATIASRNEDRAEFAVSLSPTAGLCVAATMQYTSVANLATSNILGPILGTGAVGANITTPYWWPYLGSGALALDSLGVFSAGAAGYVPGSPAVSSPARHLVRHPGGVAGITACVNGVCQTNGTTSTWGAPAFTRIILDRATAATGGATQHLISRVQVDPDATRCTP